MTTDAAVDAGAAAARAEGRGRRHVQRDHRRRRVLDQRLRVRARQRRERRRADRATTVRCSSAASGPRASRWRSASCAAARARPSSITVSVTGAASDDDARRAARAIANSPLVKTAVHGGDPNWGRLDRRRRPLRRGVRARARASCGSADVTLFARRHARSTSARRRPPTYLQGKDIDARGRSRHRRQRSVADVDVRSQRRVRAHQRRVPDLVRWTNHGERRSMKRAALKMAVGPGRTDAVPVDARLRPGAADGVPARARRELKAARAAQPPPRAAARRPARRAAVREAVAADALDVSDRRARARRRHHRAAGGRRARRPRVDRRRRAQSRALGRRRGRPHVRAGAARGVRRRRAAAARRQRAHRRGASVPGAGRLPDAARAARHRCAAARSPSSATATTSPRRWRRRR